jgi:hypothetical protein
MSLSASEAATAVGLSRDGILKAIRSGKISAEKNQNGEWRIEPVELFRVYAPVTSSPQTTSANIQTPIVDSPQTRSEPSVESLQAELRQFQQRLADKDDVIADLRTRLDAEADERRKLTMILTDTQHQRTPEVPPEPTTPSTERNRSWWGRLLGR